MGNDVVLVNGRIWTGRGEVSAVGIRDGRVAAAGEPAEVRDRLGNDTTVVDVEGRRVIPGLIDSHIHVVRAGLTWSQTVRWDDIDDLATGLNRIVEAVSSTPGEGWIRVLGGWHPHRFPERRGPTKAELDQVGGNHPVYVQLLYEEGVLNSRGLDRLLASGEVPGVETDGSGGHTGRITGPAAFSRVLSLFEEPTEDESVASTKALMDDLTGFGVTGVIDPGGFGITPTTYRSLFRLWRDGMLPLRVRLYLVPSTRGDELSDIREWIKYIHPGFGDAMLRYVGMGEIVHFGCHDMEGVTPFELEDRTKRELLEISELLATNGWPIHLHAILDDTISGVLDVWEEVDRKHPLRDLRFSLAHAEAISQRNLRRVAHLGLGIAIQNRLMFRSADSAHVWGAQVASEAPPVRDMTAMGIPVGGGTDATVVTPPDPWRAVRWLVTGESDDGAPPRSERQRLSVAQALQVFTKGSAWFSFEEGDRGHLDVGSHADMAVLDSDPFTVEPAAVSSIRSDLTLVGGQPAHIGGPFGGLTV